MSSSTTLYPVYYVEVIKESNGLISKDRHYFRTPNDCSSYVIGLLNDYDSQLRSNPLFTPSLKLKY